MTSEQISELSAELRFKIARKVFGQSVNSKIMNEIQLEMFKYLCPILIDKEDSSVRVNTIAKPKVYARRTFRR